MPRASSSGPATCDVLEVEEGEEVFITSSIWRGEWDGHEDARNTCTYRLWQREVEIHVQHHIGN